MVENSLTRITYMFTLYYIYKHYMFEKIIVSVQKRNEIALKFEKR